MNIHQNVYTSIYARGLISDIHEMIPGGKVDLDALESAIHNNVVKILWARDSTNKVIGYAAYQKDARDLPSFKGRKNLKPKMYLNSITVVPTDQSKLVEAALLRQVMEVAKGRLYLHHSGNPWYREFATNFGFTYKETDCGTYKDGSPKIEMMLQAKVII